MPSESQARPRPLIATDDVDLLDDLLRLSAAAQVEPDIATSLAATRARWSTAPIVIVGIDVAQALSNAQVPRRASVIVATQDGDDASVWQLAVSIGAESVVVLPGDETELVDRFAEMAEASAVPGEVLSVVGARGGAGASSFAAALATTSVANGLQTSAVDLDPLGPGLGLMLGANGTEGLHWSDVGRTRGRVPSGALTTGLPNVNGVAVLGWGPTVSETPWPGSAGAAIDAMRRASDLVVVDLARSPSDLAGEALSRTRAVLLVVPRDIRAIAAASRLLRLPMFDGADVRLVIRGPAPGGITAEEVQSAIGLPVVVDMAASSGLDRDLESGIAPATGGRGPMAKACKLVLAEFDVGVTSDRAAA